jgi:B12-binding domain/radical SAM domain protein
MRNKAHHPLKLGIRLQPENQLTFPAILYYLETLNYDKQFKIELIRNQKQLSGFIGSGDPSLLLYSFMTTQIATIFREISRVNKVRNQAVKIIAGGSHTQGDPLSTLKLGFDYAFTGAVEMGFANFLEQFIDDRVPDAPAIFQLDELDNLDRSFPLSKIMKMSPPLEITRGCYWNCSFCQTACQKTLHRSLKSIEKYFQTLKEKGHITRINFICPSAFEYGSQKAGHPEIFKIEELLCFFKQNGTKHLEFGIFPSETRPITFSEELVKLVKRYCSNKQLTIGAQSGSDSLLKIIRRGHGVEHIKYACQITSEHKLQPHVDFIVGFPEETSLHRRETLSLMQELHRKYGARAHLHYFIPLSGTTLADSQPRELDYRSLDIIEEYEKGGICTGWWRAGKKLSQEVLQTRDQLREKEICYQILDWRSDGKLQRSVRS